MPCMVSAEDKMQYYSFVCKLYVADFLHKETEVQAGIFLPKKPHPEENLLHYVAVIIVMSSWLL